MIVTHTRNATEAPRWPPRYATRTPPSPLTRPALRLTRSTHRIAGVALVARHVAPADGIPAAGARAGAPPLVLVHGLGVAGGYLLPLARALAARHGRVVHVPDLPGHGRSGTPARPLDVAGLAAALLAWLDAAGIDRATLVGHSLGAQVVVAAALRAGAARVPRLVLVGPSGDPGVRHLGHYAWRLVASVPFERAALVPRVARDYLRMHVRWFAELRAMLAERLDDEVPALARLGIPVLLVRGAHDAVAPGPWLRAFAAHLVDAERAAAGDGSPDAAAPAVRLVEVPGAGHAVHHRRPAETAAAIDAFLAAMDARADGDDRRDEPHDGRRDDGAATAVRATP